MRSRVGAKLGTLAALVIGLAACGDGDGAYGGRQLSIAELMPRLPAAAELGLSQRRESKWDNATDMVGQGLVIPDATSPSELGVAMEDAGFQGAVGTKLEASHHRFSVRIIAARFNSEQGAVEARDALHQEDLKQPSAAACLVSPREYELEEIPNSAAVHHVPVRVELPPGESRVEADRAEFVIGPQLYVVQADGQPSAKFSAEFGRAMRTTYEAASGVGGLDRFLMREGEEPGFRPDAQPGASPRSRETITGVKAFVKSDDLTPVDARRLRREGFISIVFQPIRGPQTAGVSNVAVFATAEGAQNDMAHELRTGVIRSFLPDDAKIGRFDVPGIPGARGFTASEPRVGNVFWVQGRCVLVLGNQGSGQLDGPLSKGARAIYERTNGECP